MLALTEEQLLCCICLDVYTDPVTLPCGHNFCKNCITEHLNFNSQRQCPMCKSCVNRKCKLCVNTLISEMTAQFRQSAGRTATNSSEQQVDVSCEVPTETKRTALKYCLLLASGLACVIIIYFTINLTLHQTVSSMKNPPLFESSMCPQHGKPLELYCKNEQVSICRSCAHSSHRFHDIVPLKEEYEIKKMELLKTEATIEQKILERQLKNREIKHWAWVSKEAANREIACGVQLFTTLIQSLERTQAELIGMIDAKHKTTETQAKGFAQELEQEISALMRRRAEVERLLHSKDQLHFLQNFPSMNAAPLTRDLTEVCPASNGGILRTALVTAVDQLTEIIRNEMEKLQEAELKSLQLNALDVTLDPDTAHSYLILSDDGKQVHYDDAREKLPDNSKLFEFGPFVLGKQSISCGRFYYDVQVKGKTEWILGVVKESLNRKEVQPDPENGIWVLFHRHGDQYFALAKRSGPLSVNGQPEKVRVFVDYEEGLVSFYDVDAAALIYSFTGCSFTERLYPFFSPFPSKDGGNSAPLIISPVH
ncbi:E3 ubiquitin-protein ligase TRIM21-like [Sander vitreus]